MLMVKIPPNILFAANALVTGDFEGSYCNTPWFDQSIPALAADTHTL
jgi:hypothetical protein